MRVSLWLLLGAVFVFAARSAPATPATFSNPLLPSGADPWVTQANGFYYYMNTTGVNLTVWKTRDITDLKNAQQKVVWTPPPSGPDSRDIWAPELHHLGHKWYIYFAADAGTNQTHRIWVLENPAKDPLEGTWALKGKVADSTDKWAIDASVFLNRHKLYMIWSGWEGDENGTQSIYIARLRNPWTVERARVKISTPQFAWETIGDLPSNQKDGITHVNVNEGPEVLRHKQKLFLTYSASGCWTDSYALGLLIADNKANLLDASTWKKSPEPVFSESPDAHAYGTGHNGFFKSPDGKQYWIIYHANPEPHQGCDGHRSPRAQPFQFKADGRPDFGRPVAEGQPIEKPSAK